MYLEISARQSGKTTRLVKAVVQYIKDDPKTQVVVVCCNQHMASYISSLIAKEMNFRYLHELTPFINIKFLVAGEFHWQIKTLPKCKRFFDEFDFMAELGTIYFQLDDYICTSPSKVRLLDTEWAEKYKYDNLISAWVYNLYNVIFHASLKDLYKTPYENGKFYAIDPNVLPKLENCGQLEKNLARYKKLFVEQQLIFQNIIKDTAVKLNALTKD